MYTTIGGSILFKSWRYVLNKQFKCLRRHITDYTCFSVSCRWEKGFWKYFLWSNFESMLNLFAQTAWRTEWNGSTAQQASRDSWTFDEIFHSAIYQLKSESWNMSFPFSGRKWLRVFLRSGSSVYLKAAQSDFRVLRDWSETILDVHCRTHWHCWNWNVGKCEIIRNHIFNRSSLLLYKTSHVWKLQLEDPNRPHISAMSVCVWEEICGRNYWAFRNPPLALTTIMHI